MELSNAPATEWIRSLTCCGLDLARSRMVCGVDFVVALVDKTDRISVGLVIDRRVPGVRRRGSTPSLLDTVSTFVDVSIVVSTSLFDMGSVGP